MPDGLCVPVAWPKHYFYARGPNLDVARPTATSVTITNRTALPTSQRTRQARTDHIEAILFDEHGGPEKIRWGDFPDPECAANQCLLRVTAVALNGFDPMILRGIPGLNTPFPMIPGGDVTG